MSSSVLDDQAISRLANDLHRCVEQNFLVKARLVLKGISKDDKHRVASRSVGDSPPLFLAAQKGLINFVNFLLDECVADIEQKGIYVVQEDGSRHLVTPLWCAAVANRLEVVKQLVKRGANVNALSDTQSTPVRSACFMTNIDVVKYLVEHGADIHLSNVNGGTCLINSVQNVDLCRYLIGQGADVNAHDNSGNTALHYAVREGRLDTVRLLLQHSADPYDRNDLGDDAIVTASLRGHLEVLKYLLRRVRPSAEQEMHAYLLIGTNYVDEKHDILRAISCWRTALAFSAQLPAVQARPIDMSIDTAFRQSAYHNVREAMSEEELESAAADPDTVYVMSMLIRERLLGPDHKDTIFGLMYRGAMYADLHHYDRCVSLWKYAFHLQCRRSPVLSHESWFTLQALCKLFWEMYEEGEAGVSTHTGDLLDVLRMAITLVASSHSSGHSGHSHPVMKPIVLPQTTMCQHQDIHCLLQHALHLVHVLVHCLSKDSQRDELKVLVHQLVHLHTHGHHGRSLLHLAVDKATAVVDDESYSSFPSIKTVSLLLSCGANVNALDDNGDTALHVCMRQLTSDVESGLVEQTAQVLLAHQVHVDTRNKKRESVTDMSSAHPSLAGLRLFDYVSLKCLASTVIRQHNIPFEDEIPANLIPFLQLH